MYRNIIQPIVYNSFYKKCEDLFIQLNIPRYNSKYSNKIFSNYHLLFIVILKTINNMSYRRIIESIRMNAIHRNIFMKRVPHYTTIQKYLNELDKEVLLKIIRKTSELNYSGKIAVDGTGFSKNLPSFYYRDRIGAKRVKDYLKLNMAVDTENKMIVDAKSDGFNSHDSKYLLPIIKKIKESKEVKELMADKAYDSSKIFEYLFKNGIFPLIPLRNHKQSARRYSEKGKIRSKYRKKADRIFDIKKYHKRSIVESINSAVKRKYGSFVRAKSISNQIKEAYLKLVAYNLEKINKIKKNSLFLFSKFTEFFYSAAFLFIKSTEGFYWAYEKQTDI